MFSNCAFRFNLCKYDWIKRIICRESWTKPDLCFQDEPFTDAPTIVPTKAPAIIEPSTQPSSFPSSSPSQSMEPSSLVPSTLPSITSTKPHTNNLQLQDFHRLRQNSWQNFLKATQCKQAYCISTHTLFQSDYSDYSNSNSLQLFQLLQSDYQLPTNDRQLTINC